MTKSRIAFYHPNSAIEFYSLLLERRSQLAVAEMERKKYRYKDMKTPYEKLKSIPDASQYLKACMTFEQLDAQAAKMSDNDAALVLNNARKKLFKDISALIRKQA